MESVMEKRDLTAVVTWVGKKKEHHLEIGCSVYNTLTPLCPMLTLQTPFDTTKFNHCNLNTVTLSTMYSRYSDPMRALGVRRLGSSGIQDRNRTFQLSNRVINQRKKA